MRIDVKVDNTALILRLKNGQKRLAYATVNAINNTAKRVQRAEFEHVEARFTVRNKRFFFGSPERPGGVAARIKPFASVRQNRPFAEVSVAQASTLSSQRRTLLPIFERGGQRKEGSQVTAVPITGRPARPTFQSPVPREYTFAGMRLVAHKGRKRVTRTTASGRKRAVGLFGEFGRLRLDPSEGTVQFKGRNRTFMLRGTKGGASLGGVFQRTGPKRGDIQMIWAFKRGVRLDSRLEFVPVARSTADRWFKEEMQREIIKAIQFSRGQGLI